MQIVKFLRDEGYETIESVEGTDALEKMQADDGIELAVVDIRMEPMNGFEFIRTIRSLESKIPVILVTGDNNPDLLTEAGKWDVAAVLMKPVQRDRLVKTISKLIRDRDRTS